MKNQFKIINVNVNNQEIKFKIIEYILNIIYQIIWFKQYLYNK